MTPASWQIRTPGHFASTESQSKSKLLDSHHFDTCRTVPPRDVHAHVVRMPAQVEIDRAFGPDPQVSDRHLFEKRRQRRSIEAHASLSPFDGHA